MSVLKIIIFPFSLLYGLVVSLRNYFYDVGILKSTSFKTPTICVGNLSLGGTGKTPMVEFLIDALQPKYKLAVLSRGYKRKSKGYVLADENSTVHDLGDEPYQIFTKFKTIDLAVDADRCNGITNLENTVNPDVIVLDDAYQHRKVKPTFSILLTSYGKLYSTDCLVPSGTLRDTKAQAKRANVIVVTKCPENVSVDEQDRIRKSLKPEPHQKLVFTFISYDDVVKGGVTDKTLGDFKNTSVTLVTGIANPTPFLNYLAAHNINFNHLAFSDHHNFTEKEITNLQKQGTILTTEKDFVRLKDKVENVFYIPIKHTFIGNGGKVLLQQLTETIG